MTNNNNIDINLLTKSQKKRMDNLDIILSYYSEVEISDEMINKMKKKFKLGKYHNFVKTFQLEKGMIIRTISLDLKKINIAGIIVNIQSSSSKNIGIITLYNEKKEIYWKINPDKYYIFDVKKRTLDEKEMNRMITGLKKNIFN
jgi:hypothetical protein